MPAGASAHARHPEPPWRLVFVISGPWPSVVGRVQLASARGERCAVAASFPRPSASVARSR
eukprot:11454341-Alexandrium_andersonii.AAC.1